MPKEPDKQKSELSKADRRRLAAEAHALKPELNVGKTGVSDAFLKSLYEAFNTKELLKIKLLDTGDEDREALAARLQALPDIHLIRNIGNVFILYKKLEPKPSKR